jgi:hypothetical protein
MVMTCHLNAGKNHNILIANTSLENVAKFRYLGRTVKNRNCIQEKIKSRLNSRNACYHSVRSPLSYRLLSKNLVIKVGKTNFACYFVWV